MDVAGFVQSLPREIQLRILEQTVLAPKAHFLKPCKVYNGGLFGEPPRFGWRDTGDLGVEGVSPLSGARELATMYMALSDDHKVVLNPNVKLIANLTPIALNPDMFPINMGTRDVPHIKVDLVDDIFCVSSNGRDPWFQGQRFSGGIIRNHEKLKDIRRICMGLPNYDLGEEGCQDCRLTYQQMPNEFPDPSLEFCDRCIGYWFSMLKKLEQVYLIVPGLPRAQKTDRHHLVRYGEETAVAEAVRCCDGDMMGYFALNLNIRGFSRENRDVLLTASHTVERFGTDGPQSFEGDGITLYEVAASDVPARAVSLMKTVARSYMETRAEWPATEMGVFPHIPKQPMICGGMVEFKFLSYQ